MKLYKLVTFDVTGTLLKFRKKVGVQYAEVAKQVGIEVDSDELNKHYKANWALMNQNYPNFGLKAGVHWKDWWKGLVSKTFTDTVGANKLSESDVEKIANNLTHVYTTAECWEINDGALDLLNTLTNADVQIGVISNFDSRLPEILKAVGLDNYFAFVIYSYAAGFCKPDPRIFQLAKKEGNILLPDSVIHIGNDAKLDYLAAIKAGCDACLLHDKENDVIAENPFLNPNYVFKDLKTLQNKVFYYDTIVTKTCRKNS